MMSKASLPKMLSVLSVGLFSAILLFVVATPSLADSNASNAAKDTFQTTTVTTTIDDTTSLEKTTIQLSIPSDNDLPWAYVSGTVENHAAGHPVIIQFFNNEIDDEPIHVAQVNVGDDGSYEYKFRVRDVNLQSGVVTKIFEGDYIVKIFKVINSHNSPDTI